MASKEAKAEPEKRRKRKKPKNDSARKREQVQAERVAPPSVLDVVRYILPIVSIVLAFVGAVILYRRLIPATTETVPATQQVPEYHTSATTSNTQAYAGVKDAWVPEGMFTTGNQELDEQVKQFCDALTKEGASARDGANAAYNTIAWSDYEDRAENEKPMGVDWNIVSAKHYFSTGDPKSGVGGTGDVYEFAAAIACCLRYFGYYDAVPVPILRTDSSTGQTGSALVIVTDENGKVCICDPTLAANGWMLDRDLYDIVVENIDQNLEPLESFGLHVQDSSTTESTNSQSNVSEGGTTGAGSVSNDYDYSDYDAVTY